MPGTEHFDQAAATWDLADRRVVLARAVADAISARIPLSKDQRVLDFGCGTGLVTFSLLPKVGSMTGADTSPGMLQALAKKADALGYSVRVLPLDPEGLSDLDSSYDLIVSSMTLHHIEDVPALFRQFARHLNPGGQVALADLDEEDGGFHEASVAIYHRGFSRARIIGWLEEAGFAAVRLETATTTRKDDKDYSIFLATARRD